MVFLLSRNCCDHRWIVHRTILILLNRYPRGRQTSTNATEVSDRFVIEINHVDEIDTHHRGVSDKAYNHVINLIAQNRGDTYRCNRILNVDQEEENERQRD